jgi:hypothetical protein
MTRLLTDCMPASDAFAITPSDSVDLSANTRGVYVGVSGNLKVDMENGQTVTFVGLVAGVIHPLCVKRVYSTLTTATNIVGVY